MDSIDDMLETLDERIGNNYFLKKIIDSKDFRKYIEEVKRYTLQHLSDQVFFTYEKYIKL